jgi:putative FmdB family regulatory protein
MPIFEYQCRKCGHVTSFLEKSGSSETHACEKCGSKQTEKILSGFAVKVSGSSSGSESCPTGTCPIS